MSIAALTREINQLATYVTLEDRPGPSKAAQRRLRALKRALNRARDVQKKGYLKTTPC